MITHQVYALIFEDEVKNIIVCDNYEMANWLVRASYGEEAFAIDCLQYPCQIGDKYRDGIFYHINEDGTEKKIIHVATAEQQIPVLNAQITYLSMMTGVEVEVNNE